VVSGTLRRYFSLANDEGRKAMPKKKTKKMTAKRVKVTASGKLKFARPGKGHLLSSKSRKRKRNLRRGKMVNDSDLKRIIEMI
jgi:large subunit ribosomal protein L35